MRFVDESVAGDLGVLSHPFDGLPAVGSQPREVQELRKIIGFAVKIFNFA